MAIENLQENKSIYTNDLENVSFMQKKLSWTAVKIYIHYENSYYLWRVIMVRNKVIKAIDEILEDGYFSADDFEIKSGDSRYRGEGLIITYKYAPYSYNVTFPTSQSHKDNSDYYEINGEMSPGNISFKESFTVIDYEGFLDGLKKWLELVRQELNYQPVIRAIEKQQIEINKLSQIIKDIDETSFSDDEIEKMKVNLNELQKKMEDSIKSIEKDKDKLKTELALLKEQFKGLQDSLATNNKRNFARKLVSRISTWMQNPNNRILLQDGANVVKGIIEDKIKQ